MAISLDDKSREIVSLFKNSLGQDVPITDRSFLYQFALAIASLSVSIDKKAIYAVRENLAISSSEGGLTEIGRNVLGRDPFESISSELRLRFSVAQDVVIPPGTEFIAEENGLTYVTLVTFIGDVTGVLDIDVTALLSGGATNVSDNSVITISSPLAGVTSDGVVLETLVTGVDTEGLEEYRTKILDAERSQGGGSNAWDYRVWGEEVQGVKRIYPYGGKFNTDGSIHDDSKPSSRTIFVQATDSLDPDGIAPQGLVDSVKQNILVDPLTGRNRICMGVPNETLTVESVRRLSFKVSLFGSSETWPADAILDVQTALTDYFFNLQPAVDGVDSVAGRTNKITETSLSNVVYDTLIQYGLQCSRVEFSLSDGDGTGLSTYTLPAGALAKFHSVSYPDGV